MGDETSEWAQEMDQAWWGFQQELGARLTQLGDGEIVMLQVPDGGVELEGATPYVQFLGSAEEGVLGEVSGNRWLAPQFALSPADAEALCALGWSAPLDESDPYQADFWFGAEPDEVERLAGLAAQTLQMVFGVVHPSFLETCGLAQPVAEDEPGELVCVFPLSYEQLLTQVETTLTPVLGHEPWRDTDDDIAVQRGDSMVFLRVFAAPQPIEVFSLVVEDIEHHDRALAEVNVLNRGLLGPTYAVHGDRIAARLRVPTAPFVPAQLLDALACFDCLDTIAGDLVMRCGGRKWLSAPTDEPVVAKTPRPMSARVRIRTLVQLEADQPGSVSPELAAHVFGHDQRALLEQIRRLERERRTSLVPLLRAALRLVVEADARLGSSV